MNLPYDEYAEAEALWTVRQHGQRVLKYEAPVFT